MNLPLLTRILPFLALLAGPPAFAQDNDGSKFPFRIDEFRSSQRAWFVAVNDSPAVVTVFFGLTGSNLEADKRLPLTFVVPPHSSQDIVYITQAVRWEPMRYSIRYSFQPGDIFTPPDRSARYLLLFEKGQPFLVVQSPDSRPGFGTLITHNNDHSRYAYDFGVPEGTLVTAARDGVVVDTRDSSTIGGPNPAFSTKGNFVAIMHSDHTISYYAHLAPRSVFVRPGQRVHAGAPIAYSGNTGYSHGPHLHFDVRRTAVSEMGEVVHISVPVDFYQRSGWGEKIIPEDGKIIKAQ
jgi:murein DD-endopeptidase MepM/ murein hydrolase activator NlpD